MPRKGSKIVRGYGVAYQRARRELLASNPVCHWRLEGCTGVATTADHEPPIDVVGYPHLNLVPACKHCNSKRGASQRYRVPAGLANRVPGL